VLLINVVIFAEQVHMASSNSHAVHPIFEQLVADAAASMPDDLATVKQRLCKAAWHAAEAQVMFDYCCQHAAVEFFC
jgi:hypothetical protein